MSTATIQQRFFLFVSSLVGTLTPLLVHGSKVSRDRCHIPVNIFDLVLPLAYASTLWSIPTSPPSRWSTPSLILAINGTGFRLGEQVFCDSRLFRTGSQKGQKGRKGPATIIGFLFDHVTSQVTGVILAPMTTFKGKPIEKKKYLTATQRRHHAKLPCKTFQPGDPDVLTLENNATTTTSNPPKRKYAYLNCYWLHIADLKQIKPWFRGGKRSSSKKPGKPPLVLAPNSREQVLLTNASARRKGIVKVTNLRPNGPPSTSPNDLDPAALWSQCWDQHIHNLCSTHHDMAAKNLLSAFPAAAAVHAYQTIILSNEKKLH